MSRRDHKERGKLIGGVCVIHPSRMICLVCLFHYRSIEVSQHLGYKFGFESEEEEDGKQEEGDGDKGPGSPP
jgi:hypothetical protein